MANSQSGSLDNSSDTEPVRTTDKAMLKRLGMLLDISRSRDYKLVEDYDTNLLPELPEWDRTTSKRTWESQMKAVRNHLKDVVAEMSLDRRSYNLATLLRQWPPPPPPESDPEIPALLPVPMTVHMTAYDANEGTSAAIPTPMTITVDMTAGDADPDIEHNGEDSAASAQQELDAAVALLNNEPIYGQPATGTEVEVFTHLDQKTRWCYWSRGAGCAPGWCLYPDDLLCHGWKRYTNPATNGYWWCNEDQKNATIFEKKKPEDMSDF